MPTRIANTIHGEPYQRNPIIMQTAVAIMFAEWAEAVPALWDSPSRETISKILGSS